MAGDVAFLNAELRRHKHSWLLGSVKAGPSTALLEHIIVSTKWTEIPAFMGVREGCETDNKQWT